MLFWADGSEFVSEEGAVVRGKEAVANQFRTGLAANQGRTIQVKVDSIRLLKPDVAVLDGVADMTNPDGTNDKGPFTSTWAKFGDRWLVLSVRDLPTDEGDAPNPSAAELRSLDWLVGDWIHQDNDTVVTLSCKKTQKQTFLRIDQVVKVKGVETLSLAQVIGWDPLEQKFRSWVFDSAGGFGNGVWERRGNAWVVGAEGVRTDGRRASGANQWRFIDDNTFEWTANDRQIGGEPQPDLHARYTRVMGK